jgi:hypothetical protein
MTIKINSFKVEKAIVALIGIIYYFINKPGHISLDSYMHMSEGYTGIYESFHPPFVSFIFGNIYKYFGTTTPIVVLNIFLLVYFVYFLLNQMKGAPFKYRLPIFLFMLTPVPLLYSGIIWKDVLSAHCGLALFATAVKYSESSRKLYLFFSLFLMACVLLTRQHGFIIVFFLSPLLGFKKGRTFRKGALLSFTTFIIAIMFSFLLFKAVELSAKKMTTSTVGIGFHLLKVYDIAGSVTQDPSIDIAPFFQNKIDAPGLSKDMQKKYSPERIEYLLISEEFQPGLTFENVKNAWDFIFRHHFISYAKHRLDFFSWILGMQNPKRCIPIVAGHFFQDESASKFFGNNLLPSPFTDFLNSYGYKFVKKGFFSPIFYLLLGLITLGILLKIGIKETWNYILLDISAIAYTFSFLVTGIACDFRYLYFPCLAFFFIFILSVWKFKESRNTTI